MKQRWGVKKRFAEVKTRVLTGGRTLRERLEYRVIQEWAPFPLGVLVTAAHTIVVALEKIHMKSFLGTLFFSPLLVFGKWIRRGPASPYILIS